MRPMATMQNERINHYKRAVKWLMYTCSLSIVKMANSISRTMTLAETLRLHIMANGIRMWSAFSTAKLLLRAATN